jgi:hypothetical protein
VKAAGATIAALAVVLIACTLGLVLITPATTRLAAHGTAAQLDQLTAAGQLRADAPVPGRYRNLVLAAGQVCPQIGPAHIGAQIEVESGWNPRAFTEAGDQPAHGIAQFTAPTWASWGGDYQIRIHHTTTGGPALVITGGGQPGDPYTPAHAIIAQAHLMCDLHRWARQQLAAGRLAGAGPLQLAWAAYFCGRGCILNAGGLPAGGLAGEYPGKVADALTRYGTVSQVGGGWVFPLPAGSWQRTSGYGMRTLGGRTSHHDGVDWAAPEGTPIYAAGAGRVLTAGCTSPTCGRPGDLSMPGSGLVVAVDHGHGVTTRYAHALALAVTAGQQVTAGQIIGWVGSTGHSTGNHLHFQVSRHGTTVDPETFLHNAGVRAQPSRRRRSPPATGRRRKP